MLITKQNNLKKGSILLENKIIKHSQNIKILGTIFNDCLDWSDHVSIGYDSLISQLKRRKHTVLTMAKYVDNNFAIKYANSILISKLNYHMQIWGSKINKILLQTATTISNCKPGRTDDFILKSINWNNFDQMYKNSIIKITHKLLNKDNSNKHFLFNIITHGRNVRNTAENKCGTMKK